jgi:CheY-like chemotaxis protein
MFARDPEFEVLGEAADGAEAVRLAQALKPDVILMDLRIPRHGLPAQGRSPHRPAAGSPGSRSGPGRTLGVSDRAAAVAEAFNRGLLTPTP